MGRPKVEKKPGKVDIKKVEKKPDKSESKAIKEAASQSQGIKEETDHNRTHISKR